MAQECAPSWLAKLESTLKSITWNKANPDWENVCVIGDRMNNTGPGIRSTAGYILLKAGITANNKKAKPLIDQYNRSIGLVDEHKAA
jgi:hypothetical protein